MKTETISKVQALVKIENLRHYGNGQIFTVTFRKKNGQFRRINGRFGVRKRTSGKGLKFVPYLKGLASVYEMRNNHRFVRFDTVLNLNACKRKFVVV